MSKESQDKVREFVTKLTEKLGTLPSERPKQRYALIKERDLRILLDVVEEAIKTTNPKTINEALVDIKEGLQETIEEADYLSLEEKQTLLEGLRKSRRGTQHHQEA